MKRSFWGRYAAQRHFFRRRSNILNTSVKFVCSRCGAVTFTYAAQNSAEKTKMDFCDVLSSLGSWGGKPLVSARGGSTFPESWVNETPSTLHFISFPLNTLLSQSEKHTHKLSSGFLCYNTTISVTFIKVLLEPSHHHHLINRFHLFPKPKSSFWELKSWSRVGIIIQGLKPSSKRLGMLIEFLWFVLYRCMLN
jgi:hypothetical protein